MNSEVYHVGVARADITPPVSIRLIGYAVREGVSHRVDEPLTATVLVVRGSGKTIAIVAHDWGIASVSFTNAIRERCACVLGISPSNVLINFNHSHSAPVVPGWMPYDTPEQLGMQNRHGEDMSLALERACATALAQLQSARISVGWGECRANINRRERSSDGKILVGENPAGPCDHTVGVIRVDCLDGAPLAVAFRYSCHTVTLGPKTNLISPDFAGAARKVVESTLRCPSLFLQGCAGNVNPITGIGQIADSAPQVCEDKDRIGQMLGGEVLKVCGMLRTHRRRKEPVLVNSVAPYWLYEYEELLPGAEGVVHAAETTLSLPLVPFPDLDDVQRERKDHAQRLQDAEQRGDRAADLQVTKRFAFWAERRLEAATSGPNPLMISVSIQLLRIGNIALLAIPLEVMAETGNAMRAAFQEHETFVLGYSNGVISYLPTPEISREGGMESKLAYKNYLVPAEIPGDWEPRIRQTAIQLLQAT